METEISCRPSVKRLFFFFFLTASVFQCMPPYIFFSFFFFFLNGRRTTSMGDAEKAYRPLLERRQHGGRSKWSSRTPIAALGGEKRQALSPFRWRCVLAINTSSSRSSSTSGRAPLSKRWLFNLSLLFFFSLGPTFILSKRARELYCATWSGINQQRWQCLKKTSKCVKNERERERDGEQVSWEDRLAVNGRGRRRVSFWRW